MSNNKSEPTPQTEPTATDNLADAADALFNQVQKVFQDADMQSVFAIAAAHKFPMDKLPQLTSEMNAMKQALEAWKQEKPLAPVVPFTQPTE